MHGCAILDKSFCAGFAVAVIDSRMGRNRGFIKQHVGKNSPDAGQVGAVVQTAEILGKCGELRFYFYDLGYKNSSQINFVLAWFGKCESP